MDQYTLPNADDFEVFGHNVEGGRFDIYKIVDIDRKACYLFNGSSTTDFANRCDNHYLQEVSLTITDDEFLNTKAKLNYALPPTLAHPHPFVDCDNFYVRNILATLMVAVKNDEDGLDNLLEPTSSPLDDLGLDLDI